MLSPSPAAGRPARVLGHNDPSYLGPPILIVPIIITLRREIGKTCYYFIMSCTVV